MPLKNLLDGLTIAARLDGRVGSFISVSAEIV